MKTTDIDLKSEKLTEEAPFGITRHGFRHRQPTRYVQLGSGLRLVSRVSKRVQVGTYWLSANSSPSRSLVSSEGFLDRPVLLVSHKAEDVVA